MKQDFSKRIAIIVRKDIANWQVLVAIAHISEYLGIGVFGENEQIKNLTKKFSLWK